MANIITRKMQERQVKKSGFGPTESGSHWSDPKPYVDWYDNGLFIGYNSDETWLYFRFPEDVRTEWLENPRDAIYNQSDFTKVVAAFGTELDAQRERMKKDKRREFHIQITQSRFKGIIPPADATPEMKDYLYRMSLGDSYKEMMSIANEQKLETRYSKPIWNGYIGIKLHNKGIFSNQHGFSQRFERYKDFFFGRLSEEYLRMESYTADIQDVSRIMTQNGFRQITPSSFDDDFRNLTAWYGIEDKTFAVPQELQNARMREPKHGLSLITPNWGEIAFHSLIADRDSPAYRDPLGGSSTWGSKMFSPGSNVVAISIRGQIRSPKIFENVIQQQFEKVKSSGDRSLMAAVQQRMKETSLVAPIDNAEIVVASKIRSGKVPEVDRIAKSSQMSLRPLVDRQPDGLFHTLPTYPKRINPVPTTNKRRPELTNAMLPGIISMSGIFQSTKPCASSGYLMGLSVRGFEFKEIYTGLDAAKEKSGSPSILISGAPGSGKALTLDTLVMTEHGQKPLRDVKVGTKVYASDGKLYPVSFVTETMHDRLLFRVRTDDGQFFDADAEHQWLVSTHSDRHYKDADEIASIRSDELLLADAVNKLALSVEDDAVDTGKGIARLIRDSGLMMEDSMFVVENDVRSILSFMEVPSHRDRHPINGREVNFYRVSDALNAVSTRIRQRASVVISDQVAQTMTTSEMIDWMNASGSNRLLTIPVPAALEGVQKDLPLDPYLLGVWIGDGASESRLAAHHDPSLKVSDREALIREIERAGFDHRVSESDPYRVQVYGLNTLLKKIGAKSGESYYKTIPSEYMTASFEQRLALVQGMMDADGWVNDNESNNIARFSNSERSVMNQFVELVRSLGVKVRWESCEEHSYDCTCDNTLTEEERDQKSRTMKNGHVIRPRKQTLGVAFSTDLPMFRYDRKAEVFNAYAGVKSRHLSVVSIEEIESEPVRCISVESPDRSYLIGQGVVTHNTQQMMQLAHQANRWGQKQYFFNPKSVGTLADSFNGMRNSVVIRIDHAFLQNNPGLLDVTYYIEDGVTCANILGEAIFKARHMESDDYTDLRAELKAEIRKRALNPNNNSAHDIIFGNGLSGEKGTKAIPDEKTVVFLKQKIETSAFWKAFLDSGRGSGVIRERINTAEAILFEWEEGLDLPTSGQGASDEQLDNLLSVTTLFQYAVTDLVASGGGLLQIDESSVLKQSEEARSRLVKGGREWRQAGITLIMGTQNISDWLDTSDADTGNAKDALDSYFARYLIMSINPKAKHEINAYYQIAALERSDQHTRFITHAGTTHQRIPFAYYVDNLYEWEGPILCGPWPDRELNLGRTDKDGEREREAALKKNMSNRKLDEGALQDESFGGELRIAVATLQGESEGEG